LEIIGLLVIKEAFICRLIAGGAFVDFIGIEASVI
jgi:hypothetical protein